MAGQDAEVESLIGNTLAQLGRADEAAAAYRKGLDADPDFAANLDGLAAVLPAGKKDEVAVRLARSTDTASSFWTLAETLADAGDKDTLARITDGTTKLAVNDAVLDYFRGRLAALNGQYPAAVRLLKSAIARAS